MYCNLQIFCMYYIGNLFATCNIYAATSGMNPLCKMRAVSRYDSFPKLIFGFSTSPNIVVVASVLAKSYG